MKRSILFLFVAFLFHHSATAQRRNGIRAIARYTDSAAPPTLSEMDGLSEFEGGIEAFKEAFNLEFTFPPSSLETEVGGEGIIGFTVDTLGNIYDVAIIDAISPDIDAEVLSVFSSMHKFQPIWKPMKLAVSYRLYPSIYKDEQYKKQFEDLLKTRKPAEWRQFLDPKRTFAIFSAHLGTTIPTDALNRYVRPMFQITGQLDVFKNKWGGSLTGTLRPSRLRKDFEYDDFFWEKDSAIALNSVGLFASYRFSEEDRLTFTPFVGFQAHFLSLSLNDADYTNPHIISFLPTIGATVDINRKQNTVNDWSGARLNTSIIRMRIAINMANFKDGRRGNIVDFGIGLGWFTRQIMIERK
jgi:hypothetical protein